jgi:site-specific recombinase XerD
MLSAIDRGNPGGKRDYAMLLLVTRLGLRISDVNNLKFENLNWSKKIINIVQHKTNESLTLPLLNDVGWALIDYIKNGRPRVDSPCVFVTHVVPYKEFSIRDILGHTKTSTTEIYAKINVEQMRDALETAYPELNPQVAKDWNDDSSLMDMLNSL